MIYKRYVGEGGRGKGGKGKPGKGEVDNASRIK